MVTQIKTRDLNNNIYATVNKLPDVMEKKEIVFFNLQLFVSGVIFVPDIKEIHL